MITCEPTAETLDQWRAIWNEHKGKLSPNRKSGAEVLEYLQSKYPLTETFEENAVNAIVGNVTMNAHLAEKLPVDTLPIPRAFFLENEGAGKRFYLPENKDDGLWGDMARIFVGVDVASGFYMVEGSTLLWDELCAFRGLDEKDLQNFVCVAQYVLAKERNI